MRKPRKPLEQQLQEAEQRLRLKEIKMRSRILGGVIGSTGDFDSARQGRFNQGRGFGGISYYGLGIDEQTPDDALIPDLGELRKLSNSAVRNDPIAKGIIGKIVSGVVGTGLAMRPAFSRATLQKLVGMSPEAIDAEQEYFAEHFSSWADSSDCDYACRQNLYQKTSQICHTEAASGEAFVVFIRSADPSDFGLKLKHIHPMLCMSPPSKQQDPNCVQGVEIDPETEAPVAYWFVKDAWATMNDENFQRVEARDPDTKRLNVLHIYNQLEPGQTRGIPRLAADLRTLGNIKRVNDANVLAELTRSYFTAFITTQTPGQFQNKDAATDPVIAGTGGARDSKTETPGAQVRMGAGAVNFLKPGESAQIATPQSNSTYEAWLTAHMKILGMSQGIPFEVLMDAFQSSYSASRAARLAWRKYCEIKRWQIIHQFLQPVVVEFIWVEQALGRLDLPGYYDDKRIARAYESIAWDGDAIGLLDPMQEAKAADLLIQTGISNLAEQTTAITGGDWRKVAHQRSEEKRLYKQLDLFDNPATPVLGSKPNGGTGQA